MATLKLSTQALAARAKQPPSMRQKLLAVKAVQQAATRPPEPGKAEVRAITPAEKKRRERAAKAASRQALNAAKTLLKTSPTWAGHQALAIGFAEQAFAVKPDTVSKKKLRQVIGTRVHTQAYQQVLAAGGNRFNFDGTTAGEITQPQQELAVAQLKKPPSGGDSK